MITLGLIGHGGMGKAVERVAVARGFAVKVLGRGFGVGDLADCDVLMDCSLPDSVIENVKMCIEADKNLVIVASGWYERLDEVRAMVEASEIGVLWSGNFSIGVAMFLKVVEEAAKLVNRFEEYDVWGHEIHHFNKIDSPSATAKSLEKVLLANIERKTAVVEDRLERKRRPEEIHFSSVRGGAVNFAHTIGFDSEADTVTIAHSARNREGYALGAVKGAEWILGKRGLFSMEEFLKINN